MYSFFRYKYIVHLLVTFCKYEFVTFDSIVQLMYQLNKRYSLLSWRYNPLWLYFHSPVAGFSLLVFEVS